MPPYWQLKTGRDLTLPAAFTGRRGCCAIVCRSFWCIFGHSTPNSWLLPFQSVTFTFTESQTQRNQPNFATRGRQLLRRHFVVNFSEWCQVLTVALKLRRITGPPKPMKNKLTSKLPKREGLTKNKREFSHRSIEASPQTRRIRRHVKTPSIMRSRSVKTLI